jgi:hypothetical protein
MNIPIGIVGEITNSHKIGHRIQVVDDSRATGGFIILEWSEGSVGPNALGAFDGWVENSEQLTQYFQESGWEVKWAQG